MKAICIGLFLAMLPLSSRADVGVPAPEPDATVEGIAIMVGTIATLGNVVTVASKQPAYWLGALGLASGVTALAMSAQNDTVHQNGLLIVGALGVASGAAALRYRYVINHDNKEARLEPTWHAGVPGLALVVDF